MQDSGTKRFNSIFSFYSSLLWIKRGYSLFFLFNYCHNDHLNCIKKHHVSNAYRGVCKSVTANRTPVTGLDDCLKTKYNVFSRGGMGTRDEVDFCVNFL